MLRRRRAHAALAGAARVRDLLEAGDTPLAEGAGLTVQRAEELVREIRAGRDRR